MASSLVESGCGSSISLSSLATCGGSKNLHMGVSYFPLCLEGGDLL